jgi:molecular chaperone GrpE
MSEDAESTAESEVTADDDQAEQSAGGAASNRATAANDETDSVESTDATDGEESSLAARVREADEELGEAVADVEARVEELEAELDDRETELAEREAEVADLTERLQTKQADFQNYKQRAKKRQDEIRERATEDLVERLLDVRDNLGRALEDDSDDVDSLREGVKLTRKEFDRVLDAEGVDEISPDPGEDVDAQRHEVMMRVESEEPAGTVASVYRPGYEMGGKVLRAAQVTVSEDE